MRRICKCPLNSLKPLQQFEGRSETVARLSGLPEYYRPRWRRLAPSASCSFGSVFAVQKHRISHSHSQLVSVNVLLRHPHAGFGAYRRAAQKTRRKKGIQCHRSVNGAPPSSCRLWSRGAAVSCRNALDRKAFARRPRAAFRAFCPPKRAKIGGTNSRDSALTGFYHNTIIHPSFVLLCIVFSTVLYTTCAYSFHCP